MNREVKKKWWLKSEIVKNVRCDFVNIQKVSALSPVIGTQEWETLLLCISHLLLLFGLDVQRVGS